MQRKNLGGEKEKMKTKTLAMLEIAIVLCSIFLVAIPAIAAEQSTQEISTSTITTASEDDYVLGIYGNANEDDTIDMRDLTHVKLIFFGKKPETELADAKYDGEINPLDFIQIKLIIVGKEKELTLIDTKDQIVTVNKPIERIVVGSCPILETLRSIKMPIEIVVGVDCVAQDFWGGTERETHHKIFFPEYSDLPCIGTIFEPDTESILDLYPDVVLLDSGSKTGSGCDAASNVLKSAGITVFRFDCSCKDPALYMAEVKKLAYILGRQVESGEFLDFYEGHLNRVIETVTEISEDEKPTVYFESSKYQSYAKFGRIDVAGGIDIFPNAWGKIDPEAVIALDLDIIIKRASTDISGYHLDADDTAGMKQLRDEMMSRPELQRVSAIKTGMVYLISGSISTYSWADYGSRQFLQHLYNAKWFHPELFKDLNPQAIHQEYLTRFQGLDIDLDKTGVFVYPEPS